MAWSSSHRRDRFNPGWERTRKLILERDRHRCQWPITDWRTGGERICACPANEVDHKVRAVNGVDDDSPSNLWALCSYHHKLKTGRESGEARVAKRKRREEEAWYSHPAFR